MQIEEKQIPTQYKYDLPNDLDSEDDEEDREAIDRDGIECMY